MFLFVIEILLNRFWTIADSLSEIKIFVEEGIDY
jgi:hypothetical protein